MATTASPFAPLNLSPHEANYLRDFAHVLLQHQVEAYDQYLHEDHEVLDKFTWKHTHARDNIRIYSKVHNKSVFEQSSCRNCQEPLELANLPELLILGHLKGSLDDVMFGLMTPTIASMRLKCVYTKEQLRHGVVLATLDQPSDTDPFRSLNIKWVENIQPIYIRWLVSTRDFVYMDATGFTKLADGEIVGYHLLHSVHFPQTPKVGNNIRGTISYCGLYRQRSDSTVDLYTRVSLNTGGRVLQAYAIKYVFAALTSARYFIRCAHFKKLGWLLQTHETDSLKGEAKCIGCGKSPGIFATNIGSCSLCHSALCSTCRLNIELGFILPTGYLFKRKLWFCTFCIDKGARTNPRLVAIDEYINAKFTRWSSGPTH